MAAHDNGAPQGPPQDRDAVIAAAREIMAAAANCALVTLGPDGRPQARMMNPFPPEGDDLRVWMATNAGTRKVAEMGADPRVTLLYFDPDDPGYATLVGTVRLVEELAERRGRWKPAWAEYYPGGPEGEDYLLIEFVPDRLEVVSLAHQIASDPLAWRPAIVELPGR